MLFISKKGAAIYARKRKRAEIASEEETSFCLARDLIEYARDVLVAHQLTHNMDYAPNLIPVAEYLLAEANCKHLYEFQKALES